LFVFSLKNNLVHYSERVASRKLKDFNWNAEVAIDSFFNDQPVVQRGYAAAPAPSGVDVYRLNQIFQKYKGMKYVANCDLFFWSIHT